MDGQTDKCTDGHLDDSRDARSILLLRIIKLASGAAKMKVLLFIFDTLIKKKKNKVKT